MPPRSSRRGIAATSPHLLGQRLLTTAEAAETACVTPATIRQWTSRGHLTAVARYGSRNLYLESHVLEVESAHRSARTPAAPPPGPVEDNLALDTIAPPAADHPAATSPGSTAVNGPATYPVMTLNCQPHRQAPDSQPAGADGTIAAFPAGHQRGIPRT